MTDKDITRHRSFDLALDSLLNGAAVYGEYFKDLHDSIYEGERRRDVLPQKVGVTSCYTGEGVTTVAVNLAKMLSLSKNDNVVLIDGNFIQPGIHQEFALGQTPGLSEVLWDDRGMQSIIQPTDKENLYVMPAGGINKGPFQFESDRFRAVMSSLASEFRYIIFDLPAVRETSAVPRLAGNLDGIILTIAAEQVRWEVAQSVKEKLEKSGADILGAVLNKRKYHIPEWLYNKL